jgi:hypothetical protein
MRVVRERLHNVGPGVDELTVQLGDQERLLEDDLRHEGARLQVPASLELEQVPLGADHRPGSQPITQPAQDNHLDAESLPTCIVCGRPALTPIATRRSLRS